MGTKFTPIYDTGSQISLIDLNHLVQIIDHPDIKTKKTKTTMKGAIPGSHQTILGTVNLPVTIARHTILTTFYLVERLEPGVIMGLDFMTNPILNPHIFDFTKRTMTVNGESTSVTKVTSPEGKLSELTEEAKQWKIKNVETITVPPFTATTVLVKAPEWRSHSSQPYKQTLVQVSGLHVNELTIHNCIALPDIEGVFRVPVTNNFPFPATLYAEQSLSTAEILSEEQCHFIFYQISKQDKKASSTFLCHSMKLHNSESKSQKSKQHSLENTDDRRPNPITHKYDTCTRHKFCDKSHLQGLKLPDFLNEAQSKKLKEILENRSHCFSKDEDDIGYCTLSPARIKLLHDYPIYVRNYRNSYQNGVIMDRLIEKLLSKQVISKCSSPYNAPSLIVAKKAPNTYRLCVSMVAVNKVTEPDNYPLPNIQDILHNLSGKKYFTQLDLTSAFHSLELEVNSRPCTAFSHRSQSYQFNRAVMGARNSPSSFQRCLDQVLQGLIGISAHAFLDDVLICSNELDEHLKDLDNVLERFDTYGLKVSIKKTELFKTSISWLGYHLDAEGNLHTSTDKIEKIINIRSPENISEVRSFLGATVYWSRFIPGYQLIASPLYNLLRKSSGDFKWSTECENAFMKLKEILTEAPVLRLPDFERPFIIEVDASQNGIGACLMQREDESNKDSQLMPVGYASKLFTKNERKLPTNTREALGLLFAAIHFKPFVWNAKYPFELHTDHISNKALFSSDKISERMKRIREKLKDFGPFEIIWRSGKTMAISDLLSRLGVKEEEEAVKEGRQEEPEEIVQDKNDIMETYEAKLNIFGFKDCPLQAQTMLLTKEILLSEQLKDGDLQGLMERKTHWGSAIKSHGKYIMKDGVICKKLTSGTSGCLVVPVIPKSLIPDILMLFHDSTEFGGHTGVEKTVSKIKTYAYWIGIYKDVEIWVKGCITCQTTKNKYKKTRDILHSITVDKPRFADIQIDVIGPIFPVTLAGNNYILNIICNFSKFSLPIAIPRVTSEEIIKQFLNRWISFAGVPLIIRLDNAAYWKSELWTQMGKMLGCEMVYGESYIHHSQGRVERSNKTVMTNLKTLIATHQLDWDDWLELSQLPWRLSATSTGYSPSFLLFNQDLRTPVSNLLEVPSEETIDYPTIIEKSMRILKLVSLDVLKNIKIDQSNQAKEYDKKSHQPIRLGSVVRRIPDVFKGKLGPALLPHGPYRVLNLDERGKAFIQLISMQEEPIWIHLNKLVPTSEIIPIKYRTSEEKKLSEELPRRSERIMEKRSQLNEVFSKLT